MNESQKKAIIDLDVIAGYLRGGVNLSRTDTNMLAKALYESMEKIDGVSRF